MTINIDYCPFCGAKKITNLHFEIIGRPNKYHFDIELYCKTCKKTFNLVLDENKHTGHEWGE